MIDELFFKKTNADGSPKLCKFCREPVWWNNSENRWYDVGGQTLHVDNCERAKTHYRNAALDRAEAQRQNKN